MILKTCVLTKNYTHLIYYIQYYGIWFGKLIRIKIPYWRSKSRLSKKTKASIDNFYENFNVETEEMSTDTTKKA